MDSELCEVIVDGAPRHGHVTQEEDTTAFPQPCFSADEGGATSLPSECPDIDLDESFGSGSESFYSTETNIRFESLESLIGQSISSGHLYTSALSLLKSTSPPDYPLITKQDYPLISRTLSDFVTEFKHYPGLLNSDNILTDSQETLHSLPEVAEQNKSTLYTKYNPNFENLSVSMSTLPRTTSPAGSEEGEKKKKGLISSFRKSRKSSRKVRDQKHASEISLPAAFKTDKSDDEQDSRDSESSTPTSSNSNTLNVSLPNVSKSRSLPRGKGIVTNLIDPVQGANVERLNGNMVIVNDGDIKGQRTTSLTRVDQKINNKQSDINLLQKNEKATKTDKGKLGTFLRKEVKKQTPEIRVEPSPDRPEHFKEEKGIPKMIKRATSSSPRPDSRTSSSSALAPQNLPIGRSSSSSSINKSSTSINKSSSSVSINKSEVSATDSSFRSYIQTVQFVKEETKVKSSEKPVQSINKEIKVKTSENLGIEKSGETTSKINTVASPPTVKKVDPKQQPTEKSPLKSEAEIETSKNSTFPKEEKSKTLPVDMKRPSTTLLKPPSSEVTRKRSNGSKFISKIIRGGFSRKSKKDDRNNKHVSPSDLKENSVQISPPIPQASTVSSTLETIDINPSYPENTNDKPKSSTAYLTKLVEDKNVLDNPSCSNTLHIPNPINSHSHTALHSMILEYSDDVSQKSITNNFAINSKSKTADCEINDLSSSDKEYFLKDNNSIASFDEFIACIQHSEGFLSPDTISTTGSFKALDQKSFTNALITTCKERDNMSESNKLSTNEFKLNTEIDSSLLSTEKLDCKIISFDKVSNKNITLDDSKSSVKGFQRTDSTVSLSNTTYQNSSSLSPVDINIFANRKNTHRPNVVSLFEATTTVASIVSPKPIWSTSSPNIVSLIENFNRNSTISEKIKSSHESLSKDLCVPLSFNKSSVSPSLKRTPSKRFPTVNPPAMLNAPISPEHKSPPKSPNNSCNKTFAVGNNGSLISNESSSSSLNSPTKDFDSKILNTVTNLDIKEESIMDAVCNTSHNSEISETSPEISRKSYIPVAYRISLFSNNISGDSKMSCYNNKLSNSSPITKTCSQEYNIRKSPTKMLTDAASKLTVVKSSATSKTNDSEVSNKINSSNIFESKSNPVSSLHSPSKSSIKLLSGSDTLSPVLSPSKSPSKILTESAKLSFLKSHDNERILISNAKNGSNDESYTLSPPTNTITEAHKLQICKEIYGLSNESIKIKQDNNQIDLPLPSPRKSPTKSLTEAAKHAFLKTSSSIRRNSSFNRSRRKSSVKSFNEAASNDSNDQNQTFRSSTKTITKAHELSSYESSMSSDIYELSGESVRSNPIKQDNNQTDAPLPSPRKSPTKSLTEAAKHAFLTTSSNIRRNSSFNKSLRKSPTKALCEAARHAFVTSASVITTTCSVNPMENPSTSNNNASSSTNENSFGSSSLTYSTISPSIMTFSPIVLPALNSIDINIVPKSSARIASPPINIMKMKSTTASHPALHFSSLAYSFSEGSPLAASSPLDASCKLLAAASPHTVSSPVIPLSANDSDLSPKVEHTFVSTSSIDSPASLTFESPTPLSSSSETLPSLPTSDTYGSETTTHESMNTTKSSFTESSSSVDPSTSLESSMEKSDKISTCSENPFPIPSGKLSDELKNQEENLRLSTSPDDTTDPITVTEVATTISNNSSFEDSFSLSSLVQFSSIASTSLILSSASPSLNATEPFQQYSRNSTPSKLFKSFDSTPSDTDKGYETSTSRKTTSESSEVKSSLSDVSENKQSNLEVACDALEQEGLTKINEKVCNNIHESEDVKLKNISQSVDSDKQYKKTDKNNLNESTITLVPDTCTKKTSPVHEHLNKFRNSFRSKSLGSLGSLRAFKPASSTDSLLSSSSESVKPDTIPNKRSIRRALRKKPTGLPTFRSSFTSSKKNTIKNHPIPPKYEANPLAYSEQTPSPKTSLNTLFENSNSTDGNSPNPATQTPLDNSNGESTSCTENIDPTTDPLSDEPQLNKGAISGQSDVNQDPSSMVESDAAASTPEAHTQYKKNSPEQEQTESQEVEPCAISFDLAGLSTEKREHLYKILVIGELGTGKTSIIKRYVHQFFSQHYRATIGVDFALKVLNWDNQTVIRLQLWDIAGQERFGNMTRVYYKEAVGAFVVFDVTRAQTFDAISKWKTDLDTKVTLADGSPIPTVLLANKCDQPKEGVVNNPARMDDFCRERGFTGWFETSAKENINIDEAARFLVNKILSNEKQGMMMTESIDTDKISIDGKSQETSGKTSCNC